MSNRLNMAGTDPGAYKILMGFEQYAAATSLTATQKELIKIRASQINGCAFCIDMHTRSAREAGETEQRIYALNAWRDTSFFTEEEKAILALTEEVTLIAGHVSDETYDRSVALLGEKYTAEVLMAIIAINAWNRIGITTKMMPAAH